MNTLNKYFKLLFLFAYLIGASAPVVLAESENLTTDDAKLIEHIKRTDHILSTSLGKCSAETLHRSTRNTEFHFKYSAHCAIKPAPEDDCPEYLVQAMGTVDSPSWATIRELKLELQCTN